ELLAHPGEHVRAWVVRLLGDAGSVTPTLTVKLAAMANDDPSPVVRAQLLCTARRLPGESALPVIERLLRRDADAADAVVPWLTWWAIESKAVSDRGRLVAFFTAPENRASASVRANTGRLVRRYAAEGTAQGQSAALELLSALPAGEHDAAL